MATSDVDLIKNAITMQAGYFGSVFGRTVTQPTKITASTTDPGCANAGASAFTGISAMTICVTNFGWTAHDSLNRQKILMHESFHLLQFETRWLGHPNPDAASAHWIDEGSAEFMGWHGVANAGLISFDTAKACMVSQAKSLGASSSTNLDVMETAQGFGVPWSYQLSMLGMDQLVTPNGLPSLMTYGTAISGGTPWQTAFQSAFGQSTTSFYAQFPAYWSNLPGSSGCGT